MRSNWFNVETRERQRIFYSSLFQPCVTHDPLSSKLIGPEARAQAWFVTLVANSHRRVWALHLSLRLTMMFLIYILHTDSVLGVSQYDDRCRSGSAWKKSHSQMQGLKLSLSALQQGVHPHLKTSISADVSGVMVTLVLGACRTEVMEGGISASDCQYKISPHCPTGNHHTSPQTRQPSSKG